MPRQEPENKAEISSSHLARLRLRRLQVKEGVKLCATPSPLKVSGTDVFRLRPTSSPG